MRPFLGILSLLWVLGGTYWLSGKICGGATAAANFSVTDGQFKTEANQYFFPLSSDQITSTEDTRKSFLSIANYLKENPNRQLTLSGNYAVGEKYEGDFENLGVARAEAIKAMMVKGLAEGESINVITNGKAINNLAFNKDDRMYGGVDFIFGEAPEEGIGGSSSISGGGSSSEFALFFEPEQVKYDAVDDLNDQVEYLRAYLHNNPGSIITVYGHTDNQGDREAKMNIAEQRAKNVRRILRDVFNFKSAEVSAVGIGPDEPMASNETEDGVAQNNRVEIKVE